MRLRAPVLTTNFLGPLPRNDAGLPSKNTATLPSMAKKKASKKKRVRRSPEQIIEDLQQEIHRLRAKAKTRELKKSPSFKASLVAIKSIDKALDAAAEEGNTSLRHALADARRALGGFLEGEGIQLPKPNLPKGPRPK